MLFINFARCRSFDSADLVRNANIFDANDNIDLSNLIRECEIIPLLSVRVRSFRPTKKKKDKEKQD